MTWNVGNLNQNEENEEVNEKKIDGNNGMESTSDLENDWESVHGYKQLGRLVDSDVQSAVEVETVRWQ